ncbi:hypothetical protein G4B88_029882 [Cannabis sativa]|uniref:Cytochrome P450 n=1 Tax=Cannabis sativa TaxID=3483 RepID=A0A7J6DM77_CANSA|nr:hypothetical protein G4B88_029882 [Cannabis sativa]
MEVSMLMIMGVISTVLVSILFVFQILFWATPKDMEGIPGRLGWPVIGESFSFISEFSSPSGIFTFMNKRQQKYGKVFKSFVLGRFTVFMTGREASKILLSGKDGMVSLNLFYTGQQVLGPTSLLQTTGDAHKRLRRLIAEPLSIDGLKKANFKLISSSFASLPFKIPGTAFHRGIKARDRMYAMLDSIILKRRNGEGSFQEDFLESLLIKHSKLEVDEEDDNNNNKLTDKQLKDNILTLLVAGHDTTTAALTWLIKFLGQNPLVLEQLREEHLEIKAKRESGTSLTWAEVNNMPYTAKVISETLRRATILPWYSRKAAQDFEIDGYKIKKGWSVNLDVVSIHHDEKVFPNPEKFDPSRFDSPLRPYSFLGFGNGPRMCPGINLAKIEISIFIHHLVCTYKWRGLDEDDSVQPTLVRMPRNKYPIIVEAL